MIYGTLGLYWALGGAGFPFGSEKDLGAALSILAGVRAQAGAPVIVDAVTRWAWALGFPLGISEEFLLEGQEVGLCQ